MTDKRPTIISEEIEKKDLIKEVRELSPALKADFENCESLLTTGLNNNIIDEIEKKKTILNRLNELLYKDSSGENLFGRRIFDETYDTVSDGKYINCKIQFVKYYDNTKEIKLICEFDAITNTVKFQIYKLDGKDELGRDKYRIYYNSPYKLTKPTFEKSTIIPGKLIFRPYANPYKYPSSIPYKKDYERYETKNVVNYFNVLNDILKNNNQSLLKFDISYDQFMNSLNSKYIPTRLSKNISNQFSEVKDFNNYKAGLQKKYEIFKQNIESGLLDKNVDGTIPSIEEFTSYVKIITYGTPSLKPNTVKKVKRLSELDEKIYLTKRKEIRRIVVDKTYSSDKIIEQIKDKQKNTSLFLVDRQFEFYKNIDFGIFRPFVLSDIINSRYQDQYLHQILGITVKNVKNWFDIIEEFKSCVLTFISLHSFFTLTVSRYVNVSKSVRDQFGFYYKTIKLTSSTSNRFYIQFSFNKIYPKVAYTMSSGESERTIEFFKEYLNYPIELPSNFNLSNSNDVEKLKNVEKQHKIDLFVISKNPIDLPVVNQNKDKISKVEMPYISLVEGSDSGLDIRLEKLLADISKPENEPKKSYLQGELNKIFGELTNLEEEEVSVDRILTDADFAEALSETTGQPIESIWTMDNTVPFDIIKQPPTEEQQQEEIKRRQLANLAELNKQIAKDTRKTKDIQTEEILNETIDNSQMVYSKIESDESVNPNEYINTPDEYVKGLINEPLKRIRLYYKKLWVKKYDPDNYINLLKQIYGEDNYIKYVNKPLNDIERRRKINIVLLFNRNNYWKLYNKLMNIYLDKDDSLHREYFINRINGKNINPLSDDQLYDLIDKIFTLIYNNNPNELENVDEARVFEDDYPSSNEKKERRIFWFRPKEPIIIDDELIDKYKKIVDDIKELKSNIIQIEKGLMKSKREGDYIGRLDRLVFEKENLEAIGIESALKKMTEKKAKEIEKEEARRGKLKKRGGDIFNLELLK